MIQARDITKAYGPHRVLDGATLSVEPGQCVVLTGDNGSGKTTLLHVLVGLRRPDAGRVLWRDRPLTGAGRRAWRQAREAWGFLPQQVGLPPTASVGQLLRFHARLRNTRLEAAHHWLERVGLKGTETKRVATLSGGMQQRLGIALTLFFEPAAIIMDEPASSLDPSWRATLIRWADEQARRGAGVLVTSQLHESWGPRACYRRCVAGRVIEEGADAEAKD